MSLPNYLTVIAELTAKAGREEELRQLLLSIIHPVREEDGCIQYDLHVKTMEPSHFVFCETWRDAGALERHAASPHMREFSAKAGEFMAGRVRVSTFRRIA